MPTSLTAAPQRPSIPPQVAPRPKPVVRRPGDKNDAPAASGSGTQALVWSGAAAFKQFDPRVDLDLAVEKNVSRSQLYGEFWA